VKETQLQIILPGVPKAKQGREVPQRWAWTEASVWTERMVATLERGIKGGKWYSLMDKVWKLENLQSAAQQVRKNNGAAGVDGLSCEAYLKAGPIRLERLQGKLKTGTYQRSVKRVWILKLGSKTSPPERTVEGRT
jgi:RNA-directed DNA polymerase